MQKQRVIGIGEVLWDIFPEQQTKILGGAPANFAFHCTQMGLDSILISAVGEDALSEELIATLDSKGVKYQLQFNEAQTGTVLVSVDAMGIPNYEIMDPAAWDFISLNEELIAQVKNAAAICFGSLAQRNQHSQQTILSLLEQAPENALKIFDINIRQQFYTAALIHNSMLACNVLKLNEEELHLLPTILHWTVTKELDIIHTINEKYKHIHTLIITKGTAGSAIYNNKGHCCSALPTPSVLVADTVGAGDAFTAAYIASLLQGLSIEEAHEKAVSVAAFICTQSGAMHKHP